MTNDFAAKFKIVVNIAYFAVYRIGATLLKLLSHHLVFRHVLTKKSPKNGELSLREKLKANWFDQIFENVTTY